MNKDLKTALDSFAQLLPDHLPKVTENFIDRHRWMEVCYLSCITDCKIGLDDIVAAIEKHHNDFSHEEIIITAQNCHSLYEAYSPLLDFLKSRNLLVLKK